MQSIIKRGFKPLSESEFEKNGWTLRIEKDKFELFTDPEIDRDYIYTDISLLDCYLDDKGL